jgi:hypothetical protein
MGKAGLILSGIGFFWARRDYQAGHRDRISPPFDTDA